MTSARVIPLFPLSSVLVPGLVLPLHIFEPRYRQLLLDVADRDEDDRGFGVVAIREGREVGAGAAHDLHAVGTFAALREVTALPDGRSDIVTVGTRRFRILDLVEGKPYAQARVEWLEERPGDASVPLGHAVAQRFAEYRSLLTDEADDAELPDDARVLSYLVIAAIVADLATRQAFLEAADDSARLTDQLAFLRRETALIRQIPSVPAADLVRESAGVN